MEYFDRQIFNMLKIYPYYHIRNVSDSENVEFSKGDKIYEFLDPYYCNTPLKTRIFTCVNINGVLIDNIVCFDIFKDEFNNTYRICNESSLYNSKYFYAASNTPAIVFFFKTHGDFCKQKLKNDFLGG